MADEKKPVLDNKSKQMNPHEPEYYLARRQKPAEAERLAAEARKRDGKSR